MPGLLPGINHILPYAAPPYQDECGREAVFQLSRTCLEAALDVMRVLEREYRVLYGRNLTLSRLPEAVVLPPVSYTHLPSFTLYLVRMISLRP